MSKRKVFITDHAVASPIGCDLEEYESNLFSGKSGIKDIWKNSDPKGFPVKAMGLVDSSQIKTVDGWKDEEGYVGVNEFLLHCYNQFQNQVLHPEAIIMGVDAVDYSPENLRRHLLKGSEGMDPKPLEIQSAAYHLRDYLSFLGNRPITNEHIYTVNTTCASGLSALGMAKRLIESGKYSRILVGATERIPFPNYIYPLIALGALSLNQGDPETVSKPFDKNRDGFVKSEGAGLFLVQSEQSCQETGRRPQAQLLGFGHTSDAYRLTDGHEDGAQAASAIRLALENASLQTNEISCFSAHGTSTKLNDLHEAMALRTVFGSHLKSLPITALKSQVGHATVAAGALQVAAALCMLKRNQIPSILNLKETNCGEDLNLVTGTPLSQKLHNVCCNANGFGGHNASLIISKCESD